MRAEINPAKMDMKNSEEQILQDIENAAKKTGSKKLYNLFDSVFAIGKSARDESLRYIM